MNTAGSRVQLSFDVAGSAALDAVQRERLLRELGPRLAGTVLIVVAAEFRSQRRNRVAAREQLARLIRDGVAPPARPVAPPARPAVRSTDA